jgi:hypothetical protein
MKTKALRVRPLSAAPVRPASVTPLALSLGRVVAVTAESAIVDFPAEPGRKAAVAASLVALGPEHLGRQVVLGRLEGDRLVVMGFFATPPRSDARPPLDVEVDGEKVKVVGQRRIVLECGKASITLTSEGKVLIKGAYLLSQSSGVNRIRGGSVQIN